MLGIILFLSLMVVAIHLSLRQTGPGSDRSSRRRGHGRSNDVRPPESGSGV